MNISQVIPVIGLISSALNNINPFPYNPGFDIGKVTQLAISLPTQSWEFGTTAEALIELYNPQFSVFSPAPFPVPTLSSKKTKALSYIAQHANLGSGTYDALDAGNGAAGDPSSMGVFAVMLGKTNSTFAAAANRTVDGLLNDVPRGTNGAISHRADIAEFWADFIYMVPPFLAYYAADKDDANLLQQSVQQCMLYRQILQVNTTQPYNGAWRHIIGPQNQDTGYWSTGNGWAAAGMTRVLATVMKAPVAVGASWSGPAITQLTGYIKEILDGAMGSSPDAGLLRNYYDDVGGPTGFGEISGSTMLAGVAYRMAVINPGVFGQQYVTWAESIRVKMGGRDVQNNPHVTSTGVATPAVNPLNWKDTTPFTSGSPEGQAMVALMYAAYRDCINAAVCRRPVIEGSGSGLSTSSSASVSPGAQRRMLKRSHTQRRTPHGGHYTD